MKYNQPFGISDPEAPYINGDPSTGTMGSIPPAASIEYPQREIVAAINGARKQDLSGPQFVPANTDLAQLARAIQSSLINTARDTGTTNFLACALQPPIIAYFEGLEVALKIGNTNSGPTVLNVNGVGNKSVVNPDGSPIAPGLLRQNAYACFKYDGTNFQTVWSQKSAGEPIYLLAPRTFYVNNASGDDSWDGTTATHGTGLIGPFKTLQRAADEVQKYNLNNYSITIIVADGTYTTVYLKKYSGSGLVTWQGNNSNPASCTITASADTSAVEAHDCGTHYMNGFRVIVPGGSPWQKAACGLYLSTPNTIMKLGYFNFGQCAGPHMAVTRGAYCSYLTNAPITISGSPGVGSQGFNLPGNHLMAYYLGQFETGTGPQGTTLNITTSITVANFVHAFYAAMVSYSFNSITGGSNVTGRKYVAETNGMINTQGAGVNYLPGTTAGITQTGGQYT